MIAMPRRRPASATLAVEMRRFLVGLPIVAITHGCKGDPPAPAAAPGSAAPGSAAIAAPPRPALVDAHVAPPALPAAPPAAAAAFAAEPRDPSWAAPTEAELRRRFRDIRGAKLEDMECRARRCQLVITGSEGDVGQTIADLESHRGLHGFAANVLLTAPEKNPDGTLRLRAYAVFDR